MTVYECCRVLGISPGATEDQIRTAYRRLAMVYHPDRNNGSKESEAKFREITEAYTTLRKQQQPVGNAAPVEDDSLVAVLFDIFRDYVSHFMTEA